MTLKCTCIQRHCTELTRDMCHLTVVDHMMGCALYDTAGQLEHLYCFSDDIRARNSADEAKSLDRLLEAIMQVPEEPEQKPIIFRFDPFKQIQRFNGLI